MFYLYRSILAILTVLLLSISVMAQDVNAENNIGFRPDAPQYAIRGGFSVGTQDLVIDGDTPLDITFWYPADNPQGQDEAVTYPYVVKLGMPDMGATVTGQAIANAPYHLDDASYPLIIVSPGFLLGRTNYAWLAEHLASHGFVVIAPEHHEQYDETLGDFSKASILRPQDIKQVLDYVDTEVSEGGLFANLINVEQVAVVGHSLGGYTSLAIAGAQMDLAYMATLCEEAEQNGDPSAWLCGLILPYVEDMAELAGLDAVPEGLWESFRDDRVDAIIPMAGDAYMFGEAGLANITIPVMAIGGTADTGTPYAWGTQPSFDFVSSAQKVIVGLDNAEHMIFGSTCEALPLFTEIGFYEMCSDPVWDMERAHDLVNHFATAFLLAELKQDGDAKATLAPDAVTFIGISYDAQGY